MATNSLSLPVDIPWERWCVSEDMIDPVACDKDRPAKWQSSIAVFRYIPGEDYQTYPGRKIIYVKVVCTVGGFQPKADEIEGILSNLAGISVTEIAQDELDRKLASYRPCNEAIVQVTVAPPAGSNIRLEDYPYFMDFQPKKRELLEVATETNEVMSRSLESLNIKKSGGTTQSQEVLDIDQGFSVAGSGEGKGPVGGGGGSFNYSQQGQWGTKQIGTAESGLARTTDESHERRETLSHTTQLTQLRHLLDTYHLGTNRAVFFIQPRPHVLQESSGFVTGPRPVEGIQEFFLIVNQPKDQKHLCLDVRLDTGHLYEKRVMEYAYKTDSVALPFTNPTPLPEDTDLESDGQDSGLSIHDGSTVTPPLSGPVTLWSYDAAVRYNCFKRTRLASTTYKSPESDYLIDVSAIGKQPENVNGFRFLKPNTQSSGEASYSATTTPDGEMLTININATPKACLNAPLTDMAISTFMSPVLGFFAFLDPTGVSASILIGGASAIITAEAAKTGAIYAAAPSVINQKPASANVEVEVFLRSREQIKDTGKVRRFFFITTRGLCCCTEKHGSESEGIVYERELPAGPTVEDKAPRNSEVMRSAMREEMLASLASPRRTAPRPLAQSQLFTDLVLPILLQTPFTRQALREPALGAIPGHLLERLSPSFRESAEHLPRLALLEMPVASLARAANLDAKDVYELKAAMLTAPCPPTEPPMAQQGSAARDPKRAK